MLMCITQAVNAGPRRAFAAGAGALAASFAYMLLSALGLGALLSTSKAAFEILRFAGAAYLIWLGLKTFMASTQAGDERGSQGEGSAFVQGLLVGGSNPKAILFFAAFFPQFIDPQSSFAAQFALLCATFLVADATMMTAAILGVRRFAPALRRAATRRLVNRVSGALFALLGGLLLAVRRGT